MNVKQHEIDTEQIKKELKEELLKQRILMGLEDDEIDLFELFHILRKHWKLIIIFPFVMAVLAAFYALSLPEYFTSDASIYIHSKQNSLLASLPLAAIPGLSSGGGADYIEAYLNSRTMANHIISHFSLATHPIFIGDPLPEEEIKYDDLLKRLNKAVSISSSSKSSLINIAAETRCATFSAELARAYINYLQLFSRGPQKEKREFIESQLNTIAQDLDQAEAKVKEFQEKYRIFALSKQSSDFIDRLSQLEAQLFASQVSLKMNKKMLESSGSMPDLIKAETLKLTEEAKIEVLQKEINSLDAKVAELPDISLEHVRLQRDLRVKEKLFGVLSEQFEMAKISEAEEGHQFEIMDYPRPPDRRSRPRRSIMVLLTGLMAGIIGVFASFIIEFVKKRKETEVQSV